MEGVIEKKDFESYLGEEIEKGEFWFDEEATKEIEEGMIYKKAGYDKTIKLVKRDLAGDEVEEIEIGWR
jgi:hypothetical protein